MEWRGEATVISMRRHGEHAAIVDLLSRDSGRITGLVPGGAGRRRSAMLQPGNRVSATWRARLDDQLGTITAEPLRARPGLLASGATLDGLNATAALLVYALPDRDPHPALSDRSEALWDAMDAGDNWADDYIRWELALLDELGFGLDLSSCAVTGSATGLAYVSPNSGRAVTRDGAGEYADRLLALPAMLGGPDEGDHVAVGLTLSGHFLHRWLAVGHVGRPLPAARDRLAARLVQGQAG